MAKEPVKKKKPSAKKAPAKKPPAGTLTERMGEVKNRPNKGLPAQQKKARGNLNRASTPKEIRMGGQGGTGRSVVAQQGKAKFKPIPLNERPKMITGPRGPVAGSVAGTVAKGFFRSVGGPAVMLASMTTEAGRDSDKPVGKVRPGTATVNRMKAQEKGNPKTVNPVRVSKARVPARGEARGGMKTTLEAYRASKGVMPSVSMAGGGVNKVEKKANQASGKDTSAPKKAKKKEQPRPTFRGNWVGAAPTEMQKRGGARIKRPNLLSFLKGRR